MAGSLGPTGACPVVRVIVRRWVSLDCLWDLEVVVMKVFCFAVVVSVIATGVFVFSSTAESISIRGDYVEVRTASVFAGACHFNGEVTTTGRDALMAWNVTSGSWQGVNLSGVRAMAIVTSDANLAESGATRQSEIIIDAQASVPQSAAMLDALKQKYGSTLGDVVTVR